MEEEGVEVVLKKTGIVHEKEMQEIQKRFEKKGEKLTLRLNKLRERSSNKHDENSVEEEDLEKSHAENAVRKIQKVLQDYFKKEAEEAKEVVEMLVNKHRGIKGEKEN